ncbi:MAG: preprotein translocase subunit SecG [Myxococcales bacterium]|nr:preprotein translocase subunit SecG [Myxococcales bacterium]
MISALIVLHVIACFFLIAVVLLQRGKGAEMGAVFGGGASSTVFGSRGAGNFLTLLTKICAAVFMLTSLSLSYLYTEQAGERLLFEGEIEANQEEPFEQLGTVMPEETSAETPQTDPLDTTGDDAALAEPAGQDASATDGNP